MRRLLHDGDAITEEHDVQKMTSGDTGPDAPDGTLYFDIPEYICAWKYW